MNCFMISALFLMSWPVMVIAQQCSHNQNFKQILNWKSEQDQVFKAPSVLKTMLRELRGRWETSWKIGKITRQSTLGTVFMTNKLRETWDRPKRERWRIECSRQLITVTDRWTLSLLELLMEPKKMRALDKFELERQTKIVTPWAPDRAKNTIRG